MKQICCFRWAAKAKRFLASGALPLIPDQVLCPCTPLKAPPQDPVIGSRSARSPCVSTPHFLTWRRPWGYRVALFGENIGMHVRDRQMDRRTDDYPSSIRLSICLSHAGIVNRWLMLC